MALSFSRDDLLLRVDQLHEEKQFTKIFDLLQNYQTNTSNTSDVEVLWRLARAHYDLSSEVGVSRKQQEKLLRIGRQYSDRCLEIDNQNFFSHKWAAVFLSALTEFDSIKNKIESAFKIKEHCDKANEILGKDGHGNQVLDGTLEHLVGRWCFRIASVSWIERKLAAAVIAELPEAPEEATYENALVHFLQADKLKKNFVVNALWCGHTYRKLGNNGKAKQWYLKATKMRLESSSDQQSATEARKISAKL